MSTAAGREVLRQRVAAGLRDEMPMEDVARLICDWDPPDIGVTAYLAELIAAGVHTFESCEGGEGHAFRDPTVRFNGDDTEGWRALDVCRAHNFPVRLLQRVWDVDDGPADPYWMLVFRMQRKAQ